MFLDSGYIGDVVDAGALVVSAVDFSNYGVAVVFLLGILIGAVLSLKFL